MNWNDFEIAWKHQVLPVGANADLATLHATLETKSRKLHGILLARDFSEAGACLGLASVYAFIWWQMGQSGWPLALGIALVLSVAGFFLRERLRARRQRLGADATLLAKVEFDIVELKRQRRLLRAIWAWYLAPCAGAIAIQVGLVVHRAPPGNLIRDPLFLVGISAFFALVLWLVWAINQRALRKQIEPRMAELEKLRADILSSS